MPSEYGGSGAGERRPNGSVRHPGQVEGEAPLVKPSDVARSLKLTGDATGEKEIDLDYAWNGLDRDKWETLARDHVSGFDELESLAEEQEFLSSQLPEEIPRYSPTVLE